MFIVFVIHVLFVRAAAVSSTPGALFDLSDFSLQLPFTDGNGITIIKQPKLASYSDDFFHSNNANDAMVIISP